MISVQGFLEANGTNERPTTFTSLVDSAPEQWHGISFNGGGGYLNHIIIFRGICEFHSSFQCKQYFRRLASSVWLLSSNQSAPYLTLQQNHLNSGSHPLEVIQRCCQHPVVYCHRDVSVCVIHVHRLWTAPVRLQYRHACLHCALQWLDGQV